MEEQFIHLLGRYRRIMPGLADGKYSIALYDTHKGTYIGEISSECVDGVMLFKIDSLEKDVAVKIKKAL